jgi:nucleoside-diphosphate-sugar epimerase
MHVAAPLPGKADAAGSIKTAVEGTLNVVRQAEKAGITKIVVTSTFGNMFPREYISTLAVDFILTFNFSLSRDCLLRCEAH